MRARTNRNEDCSPYYARTRRCFQSTSGFILSMPKIAAFLILARPLVGRSPTLAKNGGL